MKSVFFKTTVIFIAMSLVGIAQAKENKHHTQSGHREVCNSPSECGYVTSIEKMEQIADSNGVGTAAGAVGGALLGKTLSDSAFGMVLGGVAGAAAGNYAQRIIQAEDIYVVHVKFKNGQAGEVKLKDMPSYKVNQQIKVQHGKVTWAGSEPK